MRRHPPEEERREQGERQSRQLSINKSHGKDRWHHKVQTRGHGVHKGDLLESKVLRGVGHHKEQRQGEHASREERPPENQGDQKRQRKERGEKHHGAMKFRAQQGAFHTTFPRVSKVRLIIEDIIDAIHQDVVGDKEKQSPHDKERIKLSDIEVVGQPKRERCVDPAQRARAHHKRSQSAHELSVGRGSSRCQRAGIIISAAPV